MYLHSIDGLHTAIKQTYHYKNKGKAMRPVLIDKVNWLVHSIIQGNRHRCEDQTQFKPVPLHMATLRNMLGRHENEEIIKTLLDLDIITINHTYTIGKESKKYGLSDSAKKMEFAQVGVLSNRMEEKITRYKKGLLKFYLKDEQIHSKIIHNITNLHFNPNNQLAVEALNKPEKGTDKDKYYKYTFKALQEVNTYTSLNQFIKCPHFYYKQSDKVNRVFHYYATIPKGYRESLTLKDGTPLAEIDLKNSQPLIIALNYLNSRTKHTPTDKRLLKDVMEGKFYERLKDQAIKNGDLELSELYTNDRSKFKSRALGQGLYFNYLPLTNIKPAEKYLLELYPNFMLYIREKKRTNGYKTISIEAQQIEADIFINKLFTGLNPDEFAVPIHDSIIIKSTETDKYLKKLAYIFRNKFPLLSRQQVENLFRITQY